MKVIDFKDAKCRHCYKCVRNCAVKRSVSKTSRRALWSIIVSTAGAVWKSVRRTQNICKRSGKSERIFGTRV